MASNPPDPHQICFWLSPRLAVSSISLEGLLVRPLAFQLGDLPLMHAALGLRRHFFSILKILKSFVQWAQQRISSQTFVEGGGRHTCP
eukprot:1149747-Pelagomonas_calceolata.AAC.3